MDQLPLQQRILIQLALVRKAVQRREVAIDRGFPALRVPDPAADLGRRHCTLQPRTGAPQRRFGRLAHLDFPLQRDVGLLERLGADMHLVEHAVEGVDHQADLIVGSLLNA